MGMFKGIKQGDLLVMKPRLMCAILSEQLALTNTALENSWHIGAGIEQTDKKSY